MAGKNTRTRFENILQTVRENPRKVFAEHARMLSDLTEEKANELRSLLSELDTEKRSLFFEQMLRTSQEYLEYDFAPIAEIGLDDENGDIRAASIQLLGFDNSKKIGEKIIHAAGHDPNENAQIAAIEILGQYMMEAEFGNRIPVSEKVLKNTLSDLIEHKIPAVRHAAVISFAVSNSKRVKNIISGFIVSDDPAELIAALRAVRLSLAEDWNTSVLELINHDDEDVRKEAICTAGVLQLREALPELYDILTEFDHLDTEMLLTVVEAIAEIGDEGSFDVLETLGEAAVDMDEEITDAIDDSIDTLNMNIHMRESLEEDEPDRKGSAKRKVLLEDAIEKAKDKCLSVLEDKIPRDLEDDEAIVDDDECDCGEHHHHHHHHEHENPLKGLDPSRFRIVDDLASYEKAADRDADEEELWAEFEEMDEEDLDADSLRDFINRLEKKQAEKKHKKG